MDSKISKHVLHLSNQINPEAVQTLGNICVLNSLDLLEFAPYKAELTASCF